jgi:predicted RND superfamily exporter protein
MNRFLERFIALLLHYRWLVFALAVVIFALAWRPATQIRFDRSIEHMFAPNDPLLPPYRLLKREFGGNEIVMGVYQDDDLLDPDGSGIERIAEISKRMKAVAGVRDVLSLAQLNNLLEHFGSGRPLGGLLRRFTRRKEWDGPAILDPQSHLATRYRELFAGYTHSADGKTAAVVCMLEPNDSEQQTSGGDGVDLREKTVRELQAIITHLPDSLPPGYLAGEPVMVVEGFSLLERDGQRLGTWTTLLVGLTILVLFRSLRWLVVPLAVVQWATYVTLAGLVLSGLQLSMVSSMLTAIVTVVGVATVMHLIVHTREGRTSGLSQREALRIAGVLLAGPIVGAILTDVAGFGSLMFASVGPIRDFGLMMVVGSLMVVPAICLVVPVLALVGARNQPPPAPGWGERQIGHWLVRSIDAVHSRPKAVAIVTLVIAAIASVGVFRLQVETDFTRNFRQGSRIVRSYEFIETHLGGAGVWDVILPAPATLDDDYVARVRRLEEQLRAIKLPDGQPGLTKAISLVDALDAVDSERMLAALTPTPELRYQAMATAMPAFMQALRSSPADDESGYLRIMLRARERQPAGQKQWLIDEVTRLSRKEFPPEKTADSGAQVTGFFVLLTNLIESILRDQWRMFAIASVGIMALVWIGFRSWQYAVVAMIPNAVPIYMVMGLLGWLGLKMNMGAAMIAAVSMGMSVDSSIHYYAAFRRARREGLSVRAALERCQHNVGLAMIFATAALIVGFGVLITSQFVPTAYFGALMSLAMLGGMLGNLIVLPLLLAWMERDA